MRFLELCELNYKFLHLKHDPPGAFLSYEDVLFAFHKNVAIDFRFLQPYFKWT